MKLSFEEIELLQKALLSHRRKVEEKDGQSNPEFLASAQLMDKLSVNHDGAEIKFFPKSNDRVIDSEKNDIDSAITLKHFPNEDNARLVKALLG
ncbi:hypothetical protein HWQ46_01920 [Shewanella sp. D64]|uniref:hypothetical protein n=1 Tax=unclassified Shewanella TaxID=196818 RepID=UPI0022BA2DF7|nr:MULTISPECIES: hypothetical protein [unclassified Shewanella]MEC4724304.1 hypothetical protein [Shewanella sp. D64]MEC4738816.1 hypothetical protein [Shewanella sp. E94]WBJ97745.1 hypothetical protein HWQ47_11935 [Shewanella sp. MTB7]